MSDTRPLTPREETYIAKAWEEYKGGAPIEVFVSGHGRTDEKVQTIAAATVALLKAKCLSGHFDPKRTDCYKEGRPLDALLTDDKLLEHGARYYFAAQAING